MDEITSEDHRRALSELGARSKSASRALAQASTQLKDRALELAGEILLASSDEILTANEQDLTRSASEGMPESALDRLRLDVRRIGSMASGLSQVASLADPIGETVKGWVRPNGLDIRQVRVPLGVIGIVYENRPNVTSDAAALCIKSGNAVMLRGSSSAIESNKVVAEVVRKALEKAGLPRDGVLLVEDTSREAAVEFMKLRGTIDCLIPRGGPSLIASILENATVPYIIDGDGNCHVYVDKDADLEMALSILVNAKTQRTSVCNAAESLVVHEEIAHVFLPLAARELEGVELVGDSRSQEMVSTIKPATEVDFATEFLSMKMSVAVAQSLDAAINHVNRYSSGHSEAIVTESLEAAERFTHEVDAACVLVNASTRFVDGEEFGLGAEIGISTQKLHARGPMGLEALTTLKYVVNGRGQIRV